MIPAWLHDVSLLCLALGLACAFWITWDEFRRPQEMWIMNIVWPVTALFGSVLWLGFYLAYGRLAAGNRGHAHGPARASPSTPQGEAASHCGAGCTLGDLCAETLVVIFPQIAIWFGWKSLFSEKMFAVWLLDFCLAYGFGIVFQYFTVAPMRGLGLWRGLLAAIKADTVSLVSWQIGMYGMMAIAQFKLALPFLGLRLEASMPEFWFAMQAAMICGFVTAYPVNWILIEVGLKERM